MATHLGQPNAVLPIHFFKIIVETNVERIKMPNKFTRRYGFGLSNPVCLRTPDFNEWKVHWIEENAEIWFEKGWKEFVENYSLHHGHFVLFKYGGTSQIDVLIFDQSALEIDYSFSDYYDESINAVKRNSPLFDSISRKKLRCGTHGNVERNSKPQKLDTGLHFDEGTKFRKNIKSQSKDVKAIDRKRITSINIPKELRAQKVAKIFDSNNPFFTVVIKPSQLEDRGASKDVPKFLDIERSEQTVMLQIKERLWPVKMFSSPHRTYARFASGWYLFAKENKLQAGDICIFELINQDVPLLKVHITNAS